MSLFNGINQFVNFEINGKKLAFSDIDKDNNGEISTEEYNSLLEEVKLDSIDFKTLDTNSDNLISNDEFLKYEKKLEIQEVVNNYSKTIAIDFAGKSDCIVQLNTELKDLINDFVDNYSGDLSEMVKDFEEQFTVKYEEIKNSIMVGDVNTIKSKVLDEVYSNYLKVENAENQIDSSSLKQFALMLESEANNFIKNYKGDSLEKDLAEYLEGCTYKTDYERLESAIEDFNLGLSSLGAMIDNGGDLLALKDFVNEFLNTALDKGIVLNIDGQEIRAEEDITKVLDKFTDGDELKFAMDKVFLELKSGEVLEDQENNKESEPTIRGENFTLDSSKIDYPDWYDGTKHFKSLSSIKSYLEDLDLKGTLQNQLLDRCSENGVSYSQMSLVFENSYSEALEEALKTVDFKRISLGLVSKNRTIESIQSIIEDIVEKINDSMSSAIDKMYKSEADFDIEDIDYSVINKQDDEEELRYGNENDPIRTEGSSKVMEAQADVISRRLRSQLLEKAEAMCLANDVRFDLDVFNQILEDSKSIAYKQSIDTTRRNDIILDLDNMLEVFTKNFKIDFENWVKTNKSDTFVDESKDVVGIDQENNKESEPTIRGENFTLDSSKIDYPDWYDGTKHFKSLSSIKSYLEDLDLKGTLQNQLLDRCSENGVSYSQMSLVFENSYSEALEEALKTVDFKRISLGLVSKNRTIESIQSIIEDIVEKINDSMSSAIDKMYKSEADFDIEDIDYSVINKQDDEEELRYGNENDPIRTEGSSKVMEAQADVISRRLRSQLLEKAEAMCLANDVRFDLDVFNQILEDSKSIAYKQSIDTTRRNDIILDLDNMLEVFTKNFKIDFENWINRKK